MKQQRRVLDASDGNLREVGSFVPTANRPRVAQLSRLPQPPAGYVYYPGYQPDVSAYEQVQVHSSNGQVQTIPTRINPQHVQPSSVYPAPPQQQIPAYIPAPASTSTPKPKKAGKASAPSQQQPSTSTTPPPETTSASFVDQELKGFIVNKDDDMDTIYSNNAGKIKFLLE